MDIVKVVSNYTKNIKDLGELKKKIGVLCVWVSKMKKVWDLFNK